MNKKRCGGGRSIRKSGTNDSQNMTIKINSNISVITTN